MAAMVEVKCAECGKPKLVRKSDVKRGWGKFCSKQCKAKKQERKTGQYHNYLGSGVDHKTYTRYREEHGGSPEFLRNGDYVGFTDAFSNED